MLRAGVARAAVTGANQEWALDFLHDAAESGRKFRVLSLIDVYTRECLALEMDTSFCEPERDTGVGADRGGARGSGGDSLRQRTEVHEPAFFGLGMERKIELVHIEPGRPVQNTYVESLHGKLLDECLNASWILVVGV